MSNPYANSTVSSSILISPTPATTLGVKANYTVADLTAERIFINGPNGIKYQISSPISLGYARVSNIVPDPTAQSNIITTYSNPASPTSESIPHTTVWTRKALVTPSAYCGEYVDLIGYAPNYNSMTFVTLESMHNALNTVFNEIEKVGNNRTINYDADLSTLTTKMALVDVSLGHYNKSFNDNKEFVTKAIPNMEFLHKSLNKIIEKQTRIEERLDHIYRELDL